MATVRWSFCLAMLALVSGPVLAGDLQVGGTALTALSPDTTTSGTTTLGPSALGTLTPAKPGTQAPLVGLDSSALVLAPPGAAAAARNDGLAGSPQTGIDLSYTPPAERDSYLNSQDFADHLQTSVKGGHHPSALSQIGGVAEGMAINGAIMGISGLTLGAH